MVAVSPVVKSLIATWISCVLPVPPVFHKKGGDVKMPSARVPALKSLARVRLVPAIADVELKR